MDKCPHCGCLIDKQTGLERATPSVGDISICFKCAGVNLFAPGLKLIMVPDKLLAKTFSMETLVDIKKARHGVLQFQSIERKLERKGKENLQ
jgi:hypothetical protein